MNYAVICSVGAVTLAVAAYLVRVGLICSKRPERKAELSRYVSAILSSSGDSQAEVYADRCAHIVEHYGIDLCDVGFMHEIDELRRQASLSVDRAASSGQQHLIAHFDPPKFDVIV